MLFNRAESLIWRPFPKASLLNVLFSKQYSNKEWPLRPSATKFQAYLARYLACNNTMVYKNVLKACFLAAALLLLVFAKAQETGLASSGTALVADSTLRYDSLLSRVMDAQFGYRLLSVRAKMQWDDGQKQQDFQGTIRLKKDSVIWASLFNGVGIEGMRVLLTPDSLKLLNRLTEEYAARDFRVVQALVSFPVQFDMLQQALAGNKMDIQEKAATAVRDDSLLLLINETDMLQERIWVEPQHYTITKMVLKDKMLKQVMTVTFDAYNVLNGKPFSYKRNVEFNRDGMLTRLQIDITKVRVDEEMDFPFDVSPKYKKIE